VSSNELAPGVPFNLRSFICVHVWNAERPVLYVTRPDGDWCLLCGDVHPDDPSSYMAVCLGGVIQADTSIGELLDLAPEEEAERAKVGERWVRSWAEPEQ
jgi:hypothetical protein